MMVGFIAPNNFTFQESLVLVSILLLGGLGNLAGLAVGRAHRRLAPGEAAAHPGVPVPPVLGAGGARPGPSPDRADPPRHPPPVRERGGVSAPEALLVTHGLTRQFGGVVALSGLDLEVRRGELLGLIGPNGSGKTTFFNVLTGLFPPTRGEVLFAGTSLAGPRPRPSTVRGSPGRSSARGCAWSYRSSTTWPSERISGSSTGCGSTCSAAGALAQAGGRDRRGGDGAAGDLRPTAGAAAVRADDRGGDDRPAAGRGLPGTHEPSRGCCCWTSPRPA